MLRYLELKTGYGDDGPAWIGYVKRSQSGRTVYFDRRAFGQTTGGVASGNYLDADTGDEYWISGVKRDGQDRRRSSRAPITIEAAAVEEYLALIGAATLPSWLVVSNDIVETDVGRFHAMENEKL